MSYYSTYPEASGAAYNAVLDVSFSEEDNIEPIPLETAKQWLRVDSVQDNIIIDSILKAAREIVEKFINQSVKGRTVTATLNNRCGNIYLPYGPVKEVVSMTDYAGNTLETTTGYQLTGTDFKRLVWPQEDNITVVYKTGYECLPNAIKIGILAQVAYMYENRGDETGLKSQLSPIAKGHLRPIRMI